MQISLFRHPAIAISCLLTSLCRRPGSRRFLRLLRRHLEIQMLRLVSDQSKAARPQMRRVHQHMYSSFVRVLSDNGRRILHHGSAIMNFPFLSHCAAARSFRRLSGPWRSRSLNRRRSQQRPSARARVLIAATCLMIDCTVSPRQDRAGRAAVRCMLGWSVPPRRASDWPTSHICDVKYSWPTGRKPGLKQSLRELYDGSEPSWHKGCRVPFVVRRARTKTSSEGGFAAHISGSRLRLPSASPLPSACALISWWKLKTRRGRHASGVGRLPSVHSAWRVTLRVSVDVALSVCIDHARLPGGCLMP